MAAMMLILISFNNAHPLLKLISINIIAAISWPPPLISQLFSPRLLSPYSFYSLVVFEWISLLFVFSKPRYVKAIALTRASGFLPGSPPEHKES